jgi:hypothetical protein
MGIAGLEPRQGEKRTGSERWRESYDGSEGRRRHGEGERSFIFITRGRKQLLTVEKEIGMG